MKKQANKSRRFAFELKMNDMIMLNARHLRTIRLNQNLNFKNFDFFKIIKVINNNVYELNFFESMQKIFLVFYF